MNSLAESGTFQWYACSWCPVWHGRMRYWWVDDGCRHRSDHSSRLLCSSASCIPSDYGHASPNLRTRKSCPAGTASSKWIWPFCLDRRMKNSRTCSGICINNCSEKSHHCLNKSRGVWRSWTEAVTGIRNPMGTTSSCCGTTVSWNTYKSIMCVCGTSFEYL